ncbi:MAG TPA: hypothetical protein VFT95_14110 [Micromonosporaceae bacterium]|nr:hypothetical protein [Micromonosporaceae bacterium]
MTPPGYGFPPPQLPVTKRIPEDQPFIVRPSVGKRVIQFGVILGVLALLIACPIGMLAATDPGTDGVAVTLGVLGCLLVFFGALMALQVWLLTSGGPVLAAGPHGLWIKTRPTRGQAIWLPWELVARVYRRRWALDKMVCVQPRDPRVGGNLGAFTAIDASMQQLFFGSGFTATLNFADRPESEIMGALAHYAAGRCPVQ